MTARHPTAILLSPRPLVVESARRLGIRTVVVAPDVADHAAAALADEAVELDWRREAEALAVLAPLVVRAPVASAFGFGETSAVVAARLNARLGLPGNPTDTVELFMDKAGLRERATAAGIPPTRYARIRHARDLADAGRRIGLPLVIKPRQGVGSAGVRLVTSPAQLYAVARSLGDDADLVAEEYLVGREYSVESVSRDDRHEMLACTEKTTTGPPSFIETAHALPAELGPAVSEDVHDLVSRVLDAAGHHVGPAHTELSLTSAGPRLIESHARPGGDRITDLLLLAQGIDIFGLTFAATLGVPAPAPQPGHGVAGIAFLLLGRGVLRSVSGVERARAIPGVVEVELAVQPGRPLPEIVDSSTRHGHVVAVANSHERLAATLTRARDCLQPELAGPAPAAAEALTLR